MAAAASPGGNGAVLSQRALNRALLERQLCSPARRCRRRTPSNGSSACRRRRRCALCRLWTRLDRVSPRRSRGLIDPASGGAMGLMRATIHLVTAGTRCALRPLMQPVLERAFKPAARSPQLAGVDVEGAARGRRAIVAERPRSTAELRPLLERWPGGDAEALGRRCAAGAAGAGAAARHLGQGRPAALDDARGVARPSRSSRASPSTSWCSATWAPSVRRASRTPGLVAATAAARGLRAASA